MISNPRQPATAPLVGMHFRPPAKAILQSLPAFYPLELRPEPDNPYDPNAVAVWFDARHLSPEAKEELESTLPGQGQDLESLLSQRWWQIGYMARESAAQHQSDIAAIINGHNEDAEVSGEGFIWTGYPAKLAFDGSGKPLVSFNI
jgi:hypothetical protein